MLGFQVRRSRDQGGVESWNLRIQNLGFKVFVVFFGLGFRL